MLHSMMDALFGCSHPRTTFPITPLRKYAGSPVRPGSGNGTYVACLDCGKEFAYDWRSMRIGPAMAVQAGYTVAPVPQQAQPSYR